MSEDYRIISRARGEPRALGEVGVCVRVQLSGSPSRRWSRAMGARLTTELVGHPSAARLHVNVDDLVRGDEIVLDGIEDRDTAGLASALQRAIDGANRAETEDAACAPNVTQNEADTVAGSMPVEDTRQASTEPSNDPPCPRCGQTVPAIVGDRNAGDQYAVGERDCPGCGATIVRQVDGHTDSGWGLAE